MVISFRSPNVSAAGLGLKVIDVLRQYSSKGPLLVDFIARVLEISVKPLMKTLHELEDRGVVQINGDGPTATVGLIPSASAATSTALVAGS